MLSLKKPQKTRTAAKPKKWKRPEKTQTISDERSGILSGDSGFYSREAYKTLRTNVSFSLADGEGCQVLLVTSPMQNEGKSITALNLSISLSEDGGRVILLDCDLRRPKLGRLMELSSRSGLSDTLLHPELLDKVIQSYRMNLDVMLAGHIPPNPSELLGSARMAKLIAALKERYDYIVIDTPPVNIVTDAAVASRWTDGVLMVVRSGMSERGAVIHAVEQMEYAKANLLGFILNGVDAEAAGYSKYRYRRYGRYGYGRYGYGGKGHGAYSNYGYENGVCGYGNAPDLPGQEALDAVADAAAGTKKEK